MKSLPFIAAIALLAASLPAHAQSAQDAKDVGDKRKVIYRVAGVRDNGGLANAGIATLFQCTNLSPLDEMFEFNLRSSSGETISSQGFIFGPRISFTVATHTTLAFIETAVMKPGTVISTGVMTIFSTNINAVCNAMIVDASTASPQGIALHMQRYNPIAMTQE